VTGKNVVLYRNI